MGYSQVLHATSEFDITDKLMMSGIFRDVYIIKRPEQAVRATLTSIGRQYTELSVQT